MAGIVKFAKASATAEARSDWASVVNASGSVNAKPSPSKKMSLYFIAGENWNHDIARIIYSFIISPRVIKDVHRLRLRFFIEKHTQLSRAIRSHPLLTNAFLAQLRLTLPEKLKQADLLGYAIESLKRTGRVKFPYTNMQFQFMPALMPAPASSDLHLRTFGSRTAVRYE